MKGLFYLLLCYLIGEALSMLIAGFLPGGVLGMLVLFAALQTGAVREEDIRGIGQLVIDNMMLFFVPVGVGLTVSMHLVGRNIWPILIILLTTTLAVMAVVGLVQQKLGGKRHAR